MGEFSFSAIIGIIGTAALGFWGEWSDALTFLVTFMAIDLITGILVAYRKGKVDSEVMFWGGIRKLIILVVIGICAMLDGVVGNEHPIFKTMAIFFYVGREGLSTLENIGLLGVSLPPFIEKALAQLAKKGEGSGGETKDKGEE